METPVGCEQQLSVPTMHPEFDLPYVDLLELFLGRECNQGVLLKPEVLAEAVGLGLSDLGNGKKVLPAKAASILRQVIKTGRERGLPFWTVFGKGYVAGNLSEEGVLVVSKIGERQVRSSDLGGEGLKIFGALHTFSPSENPRSFKISNGLRSGLWPWGKELVTMFEGVEENVYVLRERDKWGELVGDFGGGVTPQNLTEMNRWLGKIGSGVKLACQRRNLVSISIPAQGRVVRREEADELLNQVAAR